MPTPRSSSSMARRASAPAIATCSPCSPTRGRHSRSRSTRWTGSSRERQAQALLDAAALAPERAEVFPVSARTGAGVRVLVEHLVSALPESPFLYERQQHSDMAHHELLAELIREQVLRRTFQELPHAVGVVVEEEEHDEDLDADRGVRVGRDRVAEGDRRRSRRTHDQGDRHGGAPRAGAPYGRAACTSH